ncbi:site-specific integrase [Polaribacter dokdonensis]|uniref:Site-specific recombinase XerD n=1 Tax=Polaribacter dokdonensis DSW-5 TaxID=1300348 RepID=A0A0M9CG23_9FLAO|nr:site-specific integrase [Polaribacter dokdonensis]KOY51686.1 Tyrosine type site-specific recombinase [Polaribacter dokdonensis DSW-5]SEE05535.1 Site-specific recombinase XerD [Polaribacter dokdonensis DSW-5]
MSIKKIIILFYLQKNKINKRNECPLKCRITFQKKRKEFSTGLFLNPDYWNSKKQKAFIPNDNNYLNTQLSLIKQKINQAFLFLQVNETVFDVDDIYSKYQGKATRRGKTILEVFKLHNAKIEKLLGNGYSKSTYRKYEESKYHLKTFVNDYYNKQDFLLEKINLKFLDDFNYYLKSKKKHQQITVNRTIQRVKKVVKLAIAEDFISKDPFILYKPKRVTKKLVYLTPDELIILEQYEFKQKRLQQVKDLFIFCCYTGLAYLEMSNLTMNNIKKGFDGNLWIEMYRQKTKKNISVPLLPKAIKILLSYNKTLPKISNQKFNSYLKEIAEIVGIDKKLTHHVARKTFATTVLLSNGISMEVVSEILGHSNITVTQAHYGAIVKKKISDELKDFF